MPNQASPPVPPTPREYWEGNDWANAHIAEIAAAYPNLWVAVVDKQVITSGKIIADVRKAAEAKLAKRIFLSYLLRGVYMSTRVNLHSQTRPSKTSKQPLRRSNARRI